MSRQNYPNFLVIGAQKSGTSSLHAMLKDHPDVFMSEIKELEFFNHSNRLNNEYFLGNYLKHFQEANGQPIIGESTASYIWTYSPDSPWCNQSQVYNRHIPESIKAYLGSNMRFLLVLRDPVQRAVSAYMHHFRNGRLRGKNTSMTSVGQKYGIIDIGFYARHLQQWFASYPTGKFCILVYEEVFQDIQKHFKHICDFLNIPYRKVKMRRRNTSSGVVENEKGITLSEEEVERVRFHFITVNKGKIAQQLKQPLITREEIEWLRDVYRADTAALQELLGRDLSVWKSLR